MDVPDGFESWSEECKKRFRELKAEWDKREQTLREHRAAAEKAKEAAKTRDALRREQKKERAELEAMDAWLRDYWKRRNKLKKSLKKALNKEFEQWLQGGARTAEEQRAKARELKKRYDDALDALAKERAARRALRKALKRKIDKREPAIKRADKAAEQAAKEESRLGDLLDGMRGEDELADDYYALIRKCGPQDPKPGDPAIPLASLDVGPARPERLRSRIAWTPLLRPPVELGLGAADELRELPAGELLMVLDRPERPGELRAGELPVVVAGPERLRALRAGDSPVLVARPERLRELRAGGRPAVGPGGEGPLDDVIHPDELELGPEEERPVEERVEEPPEGVPVGRRVWHEGCVEFLWVQGTEPHFDRVTHSNPITLTMSRVLEDVNAIWGKCCVRFKGWLKVVSLDQLGELKNAETGISKADGKIRSASKEKINRKYHKLIKDLQDHKECTGFLVVDKVDGDAGFALIGGGVGVVTFNTTALSRLGFTTAHELGHAVGGIDHVEEEAGIRRVHRHGDLMWGKGSPGYPKRQDRVYERVLPSDCEKMRKRLEATAEVCDGEGEGAGGM